MQSYMFQVRSLGHKDFIDVGRETLNNVAMQAKRKDIPKFAQDKFIVRRKNFFTALTGVNFAKRTGSNTLNGMYSEVGFVTNKSTENMSIQEFGGSIKREVKPANISRVSKSYDRRVSKGKMFAKKPSSMITQSTQKNRWGGSANDAKQRFVIAMSVAEKDGEDFFLADEFSSIYKNNGNKWERMFSYEKGNNEKIKASHLIEDSASKAMESLPENFVKAAEDKIQFRANQMRWK